MDPSGSIPFENFRDVVKFQQVQNSMPQNSVLLGQMNKQKYAKIGARNSTVMMASNRATGNGQKKEKQKKDQDSTPVHATDDS